MMNNEIKEILEALRDSIDDTGTNKVNFINWVDKIEDYITNLQQIEQDHQKLNSELRKENERLKETNVYCNRTDCSGRLKDSRKYDSVYQEKENYKSRIDKAIEYINPKFIAQGGLTSYEVNDLLNELLNILQGSDDND